MFDVRIMLGRIGYDVVDIVIPFPPAETQATQEIRNHNSNHSIINEVMGDAHVSSIMSCEHQLVPEQTEEQTAGSVPAEPKEEKAQREEQRIPRDFDQIIGVMAVVETLRVDDLAELTVTTYDISLSCRV